MDQLLKSALTFSPIKSRGVNLVFGWRQNVRLVANLRCSLLGSRLVGSLECFDQYIQHSVVYHHLLLITFLVFLHSNQQELVVPSNKESLLAILLKLATTLVLLMMMYSFKLGMCVNSQRVHCLRWYCTNVFLIVYCIYTCNMLLR